MGFFRRSVRSALSAAMLAVILLALFAPTVSANTYNLTAPNRPAICSGNQGSWDGSTYVCTWEQPLTLNPGDMLITTAPNITINSRDGMNLTDVTIGGLANTINLAADGDSTVQLNNVEMFGSIVAPAPKVNLTNNTVINGNVTAIDTFDASTAFITGNLTAANGIDASNLTVNGTINSTNGTVNLSGSNIIGTITTNCCKVTISGNSTIEDGINAGSDGIDISDSTVIGNLNAGNNIIRLTNVNMLSGNISAGTDDVIISGGNIQANITNANDVFISDDSQFFGDVLARFLVELTSSTVVGNITTVSNHDGLHSVEMTDSFVYGNVIVRSDWGTITGNWPDSAIYGDCEYNTVTPNLCSAAPPPDPPSFCDEITAATGFGIVGQSGFNYGSNSNINNNTIDGTGNTPTPVGQVDTVALNFPALDPATFPTFTASTNISSTTINPGTYNNVTLTGNNSYLMTGGTYFIKTLRFAPSGNNNTLTMQAGDYFIEDFRLGNGAEIITSGGPVRIFIRNFMRSANNDNQAPNQLRINSSGNVANFQVYLYNGASINFGNGNQGNSSSEQINFNGIIYGPFSNNNVTFGNNNNIQASILVGGTVTVGNNTKFNYSSEVEAAINAAYGCDDDDPDLFCTVDTFSSASGFDTLWRTSRSQGDFFPQVVDGRLRLTQSATNQATLASLLRSFPAANNYIQVEFDYFAYGGGSTGADGMSLVFSDATEQPIPGGFGGSLGYAQRFATIPGFNGGWLGVGLDSFGNFGIAADGNKNGSIPGVTTNAQGRNRVVLRGAEATNYQYITASNQLTPGFYSNTATPNFGHRYRVTIDSRNANESLIEVSRDTSGLGTFEASNTEVLIPEFNIYNVVSQQPAVPNDFIISFAASTGGAQNIHEIDNVEICAINSSPIGTAVDHYRVYHPRDNVSCFTAPIEVVACANDNCSSKYTSPVEYQINSTLGNNATWQGQDITSSGAGSALLSVINAETQLGLTHLPAGTANLTITNSAPPTIGPTRCFDITAPTQTTNCQINFTTAGLVIAGETLGDAAPNAYSGDPFTNYLWAIETNTTTGACEARVQGEQTVSFGVECLNPAQCSSGIDYQINSSAIGKANGNATIQYADATVEFDASGRAELSNLYPDVGLFRLHAQLTLAEEPSAADPDINDPAVTLTGISLNDYVLRPYRLAVAPVDTNGNPVAATTDSGAGFQAAGSEFAAIVQGQNRDGSATPNFGNESPMAQVAADVSSVIFPDGGELGTLAGLTGFVKSTSIPGAFINEGLSWNEAGTLGLIASLVNDDYLGAGDAFEKPVSPVGRFYPDRFELVSSSVADACLAGFSYMGHENIFAEFRLEAVNVNGDITTNYGKAANNGPDYVGSAEANLVAASNNPQDTATDEFATRFDTTVAQAWNDGVMAVTLDNLTFARLSSNAPDGPFPVVTIGVQLSGEQDNRNFAAFNLSSQTGDAVALNGSLDVRYGRMVLENIAGPDNENLAVDLRAQYWNGNQFITNTDDTCTPFFVANLNIIDNPSNVDTTAGGIDNDLDSGLVPFGELVWQAPIAPNNVGEFEFEYTAPPWLQFAWVDADGVPHLRPRAFASFGQYRGNDRIIFWLELR